MATEYATPLIALAGTIFGGAGLELTKRWLNRAKDKDDTQKTMRDEMRVDIANLREALDKVEAEVVVWREKYYEVWERYITVKAKYDEILRKLELPVDTPKQT